MDDDDLLEDLSPEERQSYALWEEIEFIMLRDEIDAWISRTLVPRTT